MKTQQNKMLLGFNHVAQGWMDAYNDAASQRDELLAVVREMALIRVWGKSSPILARAKAAIAVAEAAQRRSKRNLLQSKLDNIHDQLSKTEPTTHRNENGEPCFIIERTDK